MQYADPSSMCRPCHRHCHPSAGCTGPLSGVGPGRCAACAFVRLADDRATVVECLAPHTENCGPGFYRHHHVHDRQTRGDSSSAAAADSGPQNIVTLVSVPRCIIVLFSPPDAMHPRY